jgi:sporulation protein YlmC with PRC-barrel domain
MRTSNYPQVAAVILTALALANFSGRAQEPAFPSDRSDTEFRASKDKNHTHGKFVSANKLIGKEVKNNQDEKLGTIKDLIIGDDFNVKFAVLSVGGAAGLGSSKIAVPMSDLTCGGDTARLSASKDELKNLSKTPSGEWAFVSGEEWTKDIDGYYGHPMITSARTQSSSTFYRTGREFPETDEYSTTTRIYERDTLVPVDQDKEPVRGQGAKELINHDNDKVYEERYVEGVAVTTSDRTLRQSINQTLKDDYGKSTSRDINVSVDNGMVTLRGHVSTEAEKQNIESRVKAMTGVTSVNNQLSVRD